MKNYLLFPAIFFSILLSLNACEKSKTSCYVNYNTQSISQIQLVHAAHNTKGIRIWIDDSTMQQVGNYFKSNTHYMNVTPGNRKVDIKLSKTNEVLSSMQQEILPGKKYSLYALDSQNKFTSLLIPDERLPDDEKRAQLRIVNILSTNEIIKVEMDKMKIFNPLNFKSATAYQYFTPGEKRISIYNDNDKESKILDNVLIYLDPGVVYTLYINGFANAVGTYGPDAILVVNH